MQKIGDIPNSDADINGEFSNGDPTSQTPATKLATAWLTTIQRELQAVVEDGGLTLDPNNDAQLSAAIQALAGAYAASNAANAAQTAADRVAVANDKTAAEAARTQSEAAWIAALAANPDLKPQVRMNPSIVTSDLSIPDNYNAYASGPLELAMGVTITIGANASLNII